MFINLYFKFGRGMNRTPICNNLFYLRNGGSRLFLKVWQLFLFKATYSISVATPVDYFVFWQLYAQYLSQYCRE